jgi:acetylornithine deacetylase
VRADLTPVEARVAEAIEGSRPKLIALVRELVSFDTTTWSPGRAKGQEFELQSYLRSRLTALGADTDMWEPDPTGQGNQNVPDDLRFDGRPQLVGHIAGSGQGASLLLLGHIDCVPTGPIESWTDGPFAATIHSGRIYGRGTADMKGGIASLVIALETLSKLGLRTRGDLTFCAVTDEESSGAGSLAAISRGVRASAGLCAENTGFAIWTACRGSVIFDIDIEGRAGHAECRQRDWADGGAVNAIEKAMPLLSAIASLRNTWRERADHRHRLLPPGDAIPVGITGGEWEATYPSRCSVTVNVQFLPGHASAEAGIQSVQDEVETVVAAAAQADPWLTAHPPMIRWRPWVMPAEMDESHPLVGQISDCTSRIGRQAEISGLDSWHDAANFTRFGSTPTLSFGPGLLECSHVADEWVEVDALVDHSLATALTILHYCN